jgi:hypothetical protein
MRKIAAILLLFLYSIANIGMAAELNYCGNDLTSVSVFSDTHPSAGECCYKRYGGENCCSSKQVVIKAETKDHQASQKGEQTVFPVFFVLASSGVKDNIPGRRLPASPACSFSILPERASLSVLYCIFRI